MERKLQINWPLLVEEAKQRRKKQNLTQQQLAVLAKVSTPTISRFENGEKDIQLSTVFSVLGVLGMINQQNLSFPDKIQKHDFEHDAVEFWGQDGEKKVQCFVSKEALEDHFGSGQDMMKIFNSNRERIEHVARRKYLLGMAEQDGAVSIRTSDL